MNPFQGFKTEIKLLAIIALIAVVVSVGGLLLLKETQTPPPVPAPPVIQQPPPPAPQLQALDISGWQTYRNEEFGFEIKYPDSVLGEELSDGISFSVTDRPCNVVPSHKCPTFMWIHSIYVSSAITIDPNESLEDVIKKSFSLPGFEVKEFEISAEESNWDIDMVKKVTFGKENIQGYLIHRWGMSTGECIYFGKQNSSNIQISRSGGALINTNCGNDQLFNQILSTFRFVE